MTAKNTKQLRGVIPAIITPMNEQGKIRIWIWIWI